jgi:hypothetical protein
MTAEQFNHILDMEAAAGTPSSGVASGGTGGVPSEATEGPPTLTINGVNPANLTVGASYADLGATITGPTADLNLGIHTFVDGIATDPVGIDTTSPGTHTIDYVVTDQSGLTSTSTRTVVVSAPSNDNVATSSPQAANDNAPSVPLAATGTDATTTSQ